MCVGRQYLGLGLGLGLILFRVRILDLSYQLQRRRGKNNQMSLVPLACMEQASEQALMNNAVNTRLEGHTLLKNSEGCGHARQMP